MKECLHCKKEFEAKRDSAKFCSTSCRVMYHRKHGKKKDVTPLQMQVLYNSMLELVDKMGTGPLQVQRVPPLSKKEETAMFNYEHKDQLTTISDAPTFQDFLNGMEKLYFPDEKEEYALKIRAATHLSEKQRNLLLANLRQAK
jgi:hypothetical protein